MSLAHSAFSSSAWKLVWRFVEWQAPVLLGVTWLASIVATIIAYLQQCPHASPRVTPSLGGWLRFCLPREALRHRSCRLDIVYAVVISVIRPVLLAPIVVGNLAAATAVYMGLVSLFGPRDAAEVGRLGGTAIIVACIIVQDAISFHAHYLEHRLSVLWEVHKVHHSIEYLLPVFSGRRIHPLEHLLPNLGSASVGLLLGTVSYGLSLALQDSLILGADAYFVVNALSFEHLRHSHIPLRYGWLERYLISPAQHHIHHGYDDHLRDKNFGTLFSIWDRLYGTIVYSDDVGSFRVGLPPEDSPGDYDRVWKLLVIPFRNVARMIARRRVGTTDAADGKVALKLLEQVRP